MVICQLTSIHKRYDIRIFKKYAVSNAKEGHDSYLVCIDKNDDEIKDGVKILSVKKEHKNRIARTLFSKRALFKLALSVNADIYQLHDPDLLFVARKLKKKNKIVIYDSHEDYSTLFLTKYWIPSFLRKIVQKYYNSIQSKTLKKIDGAIGVNDVITNKLNVFNKHAITINNYPLLFPEVEHLNDNSLCFAGVLSEDYKHDVIVDILEKHKGKIRYNLAGSADTEYFYNVMKKPGWDYVNFKGIIPNDEVLKMYSNSAVGLVISNYTPNFNYKKGSMGVIKIFEYMMAGLPFIATDFELWKPIIEKNEFGPVGICVDPTNKEEIEQAILTLINDKKKRMEYGKNGRKLAEKYYNWDILNRKIQDFYFNLYNNNGGNLR